MVILDQQPKPKPFNPYMHLGNEYPVVFCPLLKKTKGNPHLKILDIHNILLQMAPLRKKINKFSCTTSQSTFVFGR